MLWKPFCPFRNHCLLRLFPHQERALTPTATPRKACPRVGALYLIPLVCVWSSSHGCWDLIRTADSQAPLQTHRSESVH